MESPYSERLSVSLQVTTFARICFITLIMPTRGTYKEMKYFVTKINIKKKTKCQDLFHTYEKKTYFSVSETLPISPTLIDPFRVTRYRSSDLF